MTLTMKKTHIKMAKKIRLKESELISLIERVINTNNETEKKEEIVTEEKEDTKGCKGVQRGPEQAF